MTKEVAGRRGKTIQEARSMAMIHMMDRGPDAERQKGKIKTMTRNSHKSFNKSLTATK
jgi:hypothetical protein